MLMNLYPFALFFPLLAGSTANTEPTTPPWIRTILIAVNLTTQGLNGLVDDILALLPQDEIILLFFDKLETSNDFSYFFEQIGSGEFESVLSMLQVRESSTTYAGTES